MKTRLGTVLITVVILSQSNFAAAAPEPLQFLRSSYQAAKTKCENFLNHPSVMPYLLPFSPSQVREEISRMKDPAERAVAWQGFKAMMRENAQTGADWVYITRAEFFNPEKSSAKELKLLVSKLESRQSWAISDKLVTFLYHQGPRLSTPELNELADTIEDVDLLYAGLFFEPSPNMRESQEKGKLLDTIYELRKRAYQGEDITEDKRALIQRMARRQGA